MIENIFITTILNLNVKINNILLIYKFYSNKDANFFIKIIYGHFKCSLVSANI